MFRKSNKVLDIFEKQAWLYGCRSIHSKKEIHSNGKFASRCFCKIKKPNKNFLKLKCDWWCSYFDTTDDQRTVSYLFFLVIFFSSRNWCVCILTGQTVIWDLFQPLVRWLYDTFFFRVVIFSGFSKNIAGQVTVPFFFRVVIFSGRNWCSYFEVEAILKLMLPLVTSNKTYS